MAGPRPWAEASAGLSGRKPCHEPRLHGFIEAYHQQGGARVGTGTVTMHGPAKGRLILGVRVFLFRNSRAASAARATPGCVLCLRWPCRQSQGPLPVAQAGVRGRTCVLNETSARSSPMASARVRWGSKAGSGSSTSTPSSPGASRRRTASSRLRTRGEGVGEVKLETLPKGWTP